MELKLICHGMMLFWYRKETANVPAGYRILIPQSPNKEHVLRLGVGPGAPSSVLQYETSPKSTQHFGLDFGVGPSPTKPGMKPKNSELLMYRTADAVATPDDRASLGAGVGFVIDIPYPLREEPVRATDYDEDPYLPGLAVEAFAIHPRRMLDARVFTFIVADSTKDVILRSNDNLPSRLLVKAPVPDGIKLHLYCQPPTPVMPGTSHLQRLNEMLLFGGSVLDLKLNDDRNPKKDPDIPIPVGLSFQDLLHLSELGALMPGGTGASDITGDSDVQGQKLMTMPSMFAIDPAECGQGGGC